MQKLGSNTIKLQGNGQDNKAEGNKRGNTITKMDPLYKRNKDLNFAFFYALFYDLQFSKIVMGPCFAVFNSNEAVMYFYHTRFPFHNEKVMLQK